MENSKLSDVKGKELVAAGHAFAKAIGMDTPLIEIAKMVSVLATRLDCALVRGDALAAENVLMLKLLTDISENHVEYFSESEGYTFAGVPLDYVSEINTYVSRDVNAENPFPATDAYLNSVRAEGVEMVKAHPAISLCSLTHVCEEIAAKLRAGKDGE
ncbi:hypothetical protein [Pantoea agglomerans]|uniref:hypothetical protein n=1 Tax=Enterobacter agglomerans TaxID=549 RepID=UPI003C79E0A6